MRSWSFAYGLHADTWVVSSVNCDWNLFISTFTFKNKRYVSGAVEIKFSLANLIAEKSLKCKCRALPARYAKRNQFCLNQTFKHERGNLKMLRW